MSEPIVFVVDDDSAVRDSLSWVLEAAGYPVAAFDSAEAFLDGYQPGQTGVLVLDVAMPGISGLELQQRLDVFGESMPTIFISAHGTIPAAVSAMRRGAVDFLMKPFNNRALLERVEQALAASRQQRAERAEKAAIAARLVGLTEREREVLDAVVAGFTNKQIARSLLISVKTVETHRANIMLKTGAGSLAELVRLVVGSKGS
jgi:FixJ family two-component response regulator